MGKTPKLRLVKHQSRLPAKVIGYLSQKPLKTNPQQDSLLSVIICIPREGPDGLLLLSASQSSCEAMTPRSSFTNRITETYYLWIPNIKLLMLPSLLGWLSLLWLSFSFVSPNTSCWTSQGTAHALASLELPVHTAAPGKTESIIITSFAMDRLFWLSVDIYLLFFIFCHLYFC